MNTQQTIIKSVIFFTIVVPTILSVVFSVLFLRITMGGYDVWLNKHKPIEIEEIALSYFALLDNHDPSSFIKHLDETKADGLDAKGVDELVPLLPQGAFKKKVITRFTKRRFGEKSDDDHVVKRHIYTFYYELTYGNDAYFAMDIGVVILENNPLSSPAIYDCHFTSLPASQAETYAVSLATINGKHKRHIVFCGVTLCFLLFTTLHCLVSNIKYRFLWLIFIIVGLGGFALNWTTLDITYFPTTVYLFGMKLDYGYYAPTTLTCGLPIGALLYWVLRKAYTVHLNEG
jgi:energy-coupling factor transporter transmembrane protein EcfT